MPRYLVVVFAERTYLHHNLTCINLYHISKLLSHPVDLITQISPDLQCHYPNPGHYHLLTIPL